MRGRKVRRKRHQGKSEYQWKSRPTHEGVAWREILVRSPVGDHVSVLKGWVAVALLVGGVLMLTRVGKLHQNGGRAEVKVIRQQEILPVGVGQAAAVVVHTNWTLVQGTT